MGRCDVMAQNMTALSAANSAATHGSTTCHSTQRQPAKPAP